MTSVTQLTFTIATEQESDGRWIAEVKDFPDVLTYGSSEATAIIKAKVLALRVIADHLVQELEDEEDLAVALESLEDSRDQGTIPWETIKADLGL